MSQGAGAWVRGIAAWAAATLLVASLAPCPAPEAGGRVLATPGHASHDMAGGADAGAGHADCGHAAPALTAPCTCGCAGTPGAGATPSRLPVSLLAAATDAGVEVAVPAPHADGSALPDSPHEPIEHVPLRLA
jgi:hypothetical protein